VVVVSPASDHPGEGRGRRVDVSLGLNHLGRLQDGLRRRLGGFGLGLLAILVDVLDARVRVRVDGPLVLVGEPLPATGPVALEAPDVPVHHLVMALIGLQYVEGGLAALAEELEDAIGAKMSIEVRRTACFVATVAEVVHTDAHSLVISFVRDAQQIKVAGQSDFVVELHSNTAFVLVQDATSSWGDSFLLQSLLQTLGFAGHRVIV